MTWFDRKNRNSVDAAWSAVNFSSGSVNARHSVVTELNEIRPEREARVACVEDTELILI
jgi:hypothetical protein